MSTAPPDTWGQCENVPCLFGPQASVLVWYLFHISLCLSSDLVADVICSCFPYFSAVCTALANAVQASSFKSHPNSLSLCVQDMLKGMVLNCCFVKSVFFMFSGNNNVTSKSSAESASSSFSISFDKVYIFNFVLSFINVRKV